MSQLGNTNTPLGDQLRNPAAPPMPQGQPLFPSAPYNPMNNPSNAYRPFVESPGFRFSLPKMQLGGAQPMPSYQPPMPQPVAQPAPQPYFNDQATFGVAPTAMNLMPMGGVFTPVQPAPQPVAQAAPMQPQPVVQQAAAPAPTQAPAQPPSSPTAYANLPPDYQKLTAGEASWNSLPPNLQALAVQHYNNKLRQQLAQSTMPMPNNQTMTWNTPDPWAGDKELAQMVATRQNMNNIQASQERGVPIQFAPSQWREAQAAQAAGANIQYGTPQTPGQLRESWSPYGIPTGYGLPSSGSLVFTSTMPEASDPAARQRAIRIGLEQREASGDRSVTPYLNTLRAAESRQQAQEDAASATERAVAVEQAKNPPPQPRPLTPEEADLKQAQAEEARAKAQQAREENATRVKLAQIENEAKKALAEGNAEYAGQLTAYQNNLARHEGEVRNAVDKARRLQAILKLKTRDQRARSFELQFPEYAGQFAGIIRSTDPVDAVNQELAKANAAIDALRMNPPQKPTRQASMPTPPTPSPTTPPAADLTQLIVARARVLASQNPSLTADQAADMAAKEFGR